MAKFNKLPDRAALQGVTAVVTGADSGIGLCFCRELASRHADLVMISNRDGVLQSTATSIAEEFGVRTFPAVIDLTSEDADIRILDFITQHGLEPLILINNAGIFNFMPVAGMDEGRIRCFIDLHVRAVTLLTRTFARRMMQRGDGYILNMSSMSCWMPMPGIAMYSATKAYIRTFSRAMWYETSDAGVSVTVACPGGIATDLFGLPHNLMKLAVAIKALQTPEHFARKAVDRMLRRKRQYINGMLNRIAILCIGILPTCGRMQIKRRMLDRGITR